MRLGTRIFFVVIFCLAGFVSSAGATVEDGFHYVYIPAGNAALDSLASYRHNERNGIYWAYYANGDVKQEHEYANGVRDGFSRGYYQNGTLAYSLLYKDGERNGLSRYYDKKGTLRLEANYRNGLPNGWTKVYTAEGRISQVQFYNLGRLETVRQYDPTGRLAAVRRFR